jgi:triacylglycerol lipase
MSPRRRLLLIAVGVLALALVGVLVGRLLAGRAGSGRPPAQDRPGTVLLVPGYGGGTGSLDQLATRLRAAGRRATVVPLPDDGTGDLHAQADQLDGYVTAALRDGPSVDLVGYSAGGIVVRLWVQEHGGTGKARRIVTLGTPHHGAQIAATGTVFVPGACPTACQQLAPGSALLASLRDPVPDPPRWLSVWTTADQTVTPPDSARLDGAVELPVQSVCPALRIGHSQLPTDPFVVAAVLDAIGTGPIAVPPASACG